jgi:tripartite-type tricarboxylate transporter receptor subunit TctC
VALMPKYVLVSVTAAAALLLAACAPAAPAPTTAPATKPTEAPAVASPALAATHAAKPAASPPDADFDERAVAEFYSGKTVNIIVGQAAGGGYDTISRLLARQLGKHVPGNPTVIVTNMPGAGSLLAANHAYNSAPRDGTTLVNFTLTTVTQQIVGSPAVEFDATKFFYLGVPVRDTSICVASGASGLHNLRDTIGPGARQFVVGGSGPGSSLEDQPKVLREALGANFRIVSGYGGTSDVRLAMERGEVEGMCGWSWESLKTTSLEKFHSGEFVVLAQIVDEKHPDIPNVPLARDIAQTDEARMLLRYGITLVSERQRAYALPPGVAEDRVQALRAAFARTVADPQFLDDATRSNLEVNAISEEETQRLVEELVAIPPNVKARLTGVWQP